MISNNLYKTIKSALTIDKAYKNKNTYPLTLFLALIEDTDVKKLFRKNNICTKKAKELVYQELKQYDNSKKNNQPNINQYIQELIKQTLFLSTNKFFHTMNGNNLLQTLLHNENNLFFMVLGNNYITEINLALNKIQQDKTETIISLHKITNANNNLNDKESYIKKYCVNLNDLVLKNNNYNNILIGRENEINRTIEILNKKNKNNVLFIGDAGVGKTAIVEGLAAKIINKNVPDNMKDYIIYSLNICNLVSGTRYRGDFEERIGKLLDEIKNKNNIIIFIDEIHTLIGAGSTPNAVLEASNILKPALARGEIKCIGATTNKEFLMHIAQDKSFLRRFQKININEPSEEDTYNIIQGIIKNYSHHHNVKYTDDAIKTGIKLANQYIKDRYMPDKVIDIIDEAGAYFNNQSVKKNKIINEKNIIEIISKMANIPFEMIINNNPQKLKLLIKNLNSKIFGQEEAIESICQTIKNSKSGIHNKGKPIASYLFAGMSGVGKTSLAINLAKAYGMNLIRLNMSEYSESHSISKLIGAPPGYIGYNNGGLLTELVEAKPYSLIIFDEIEKGNKEIYNILLQIMDYGNLTNNLGQNIDFLNSIIILTTNIGSQHLSNSNTGFIKNEEQKNNNVKNEILNFLSPELVNRLDNIVIFHPLNKNTIIKIINHELYQIKEQIKEKNIDIIFNNQIVQYLYKEHCSSEGVRGIKKLVDKLIVNKLSDIILSKKNDKKLKIELSCLNGEIQFKECESSTQKLKKSKVSA